MFHSGMPQNTNLAGFFFNIFQKVLVFWGIPYVDEKSFILGFKSCLQIIVSENNFALRVSKSPL